MTTQANPQDSETDALHSSPAMLALLTRWADARWIRDLDLALAHVLQRRCPDASPLVLLAAALVSHRAGHGHLRLDIAATLEAPVAALAWNEPLTGDGSDTEMAPPRLLQGIDPEAWKQALTCSACVGEGEGAEPLVLDAGSLYLRRYWRHEQTLRRQIALRVGTRLPHDEGRLRGLLGQLFPAEPLPGRGADWQKLACALAARSRFAVITGGPGTGKTTTVIKLLALLQALALDGETARTLRIRLAAPTGKAAARLNESIAGQVQQLDLAGLANADTLRAAIPTEVKTLHRLLGARPDTRRFRHDAENPLPLDIVVVDEASMIDVELMAALLDALPPRASLILLGDKDQLASVEAGAVLGNLCAHASEGRYTAETRDWLQRITGEVIDDALIHPEGSPLDQAIGMLRHSHRFGAHSGIGALARAINENDAAEVRRILEDAQYPDVRHVKPEGIDDPVLTRLTRGDHDQTPGYASYLKVMTNQRPRGADAQSPEAFDDWARNILEAQSAFQLLCALRHGPHGVDGLNTRIEAGLARAELIAPGARGPNHWYEGRPILVTGNDYGLGLMNGDMGITLAVPQRPGDPDSPMTLRVAFPRGDGSGSIKWVLPSRLQRCETVYAMTVHKSQGSEFKHVALVLPDTTSPVVTKELVYTAVTRASKWFTLIAGGHQPLSNAVRQRPTRTSSVQGKEYHG